jgi:hypothetical protein
MKQNLVCLTLMTGLLGLFFGCSKENPGGAAQRPIRHPHSDAYITIGDLKLFRAYAPPDSKVDLREYLPEGETLDRWNRLASVRTFKDLKDPKQYLANMAEAVRQSHPSARYQFFESEKTKERILDFMTFPPDSAPVHFAEWNLMRAKYVEGTGLIVYQYGLRLYKTDASSASVILAERNKMMGPFENASFEEQK